MEEFLLENSEQFLIDEYISKIDIKCFFEGNTKKYRSQKIFLCPVNALIAEGNKVTKSSNCIKCNLCELKYNVVVKGGIETQTLTMSDYFLTDIKRLSIVLKYLFQNELVACEVKAEGNYRNKRVDVVYSDEDNINLVKVLTDINNYGFYKRSYNEIYQDIKGKYKNKNVNIKILTTTDIKDLNSLKYNDIFSIEDISKKEE